MNWMRQALTIEKSGIVCHWVIYTRKIRNGSSNSLQGKKEKTSL